MEGLALAGTSQDRLKESMRSNRTQSANDLEVVETASLEIAANERTIEEFLKPNEMRFVSALGGKEVAAKFTRAVVSIVSQTPQLRQVISHSPMSASSLFSAALNIAHLGLHPSPTLGQAYIVPFNKRTQVRGVWQDNPIAQTVVGYKGFQTLGYRSGIIRAISSGVVFPSDEFDYAIGSGGFVRHRPAAARFNPRTGKLEQVTREAGERPVAVWALAETVAGGAIVDVLAYDEAVAYRNLSDSYRSFLRSDNGRKWMGQVTAAEQAGKERPEPPRSAPPWVTNEAAMARKTMVRRLRPDLPLDDSWSPTALQMASAFRVDGAASTIPMREVGDLWVPDLGDEPDPADVGPRDIVDVTEVARTRAARPDPAGMTDARITAEAKRLYDESHGEQAERLAAEAIAQAGLDPQTFPAGLTDLDRPLRVGLLISLREIFDAAETEVAQQ